MIRFSIFSNTVSRDPVMAEATWPEFLSTMAEWFAEERPATKDEKLYNTPLVSPAVYSEGATRKNENVQCLGGWFALDVDTSGISVDECKAILEAVPTDYLIYTTTSSLPGAERYRVCFPLDREVEPEEARAMWAGAYEFFGRISDKQTKDPSRIFNVPATWIGTNPRFEWRAEGDVISADEIISYAPPEPAPQPIITTASDLARIRRALEGRGKDIPLGLSIYDSKVVHSRFVEEYLNLPKGDHHAGLYRFMARIAERALFLGCAITPDHLVEYAKQLDCICPVKTNRARWSRIKKEAETAMRWANNAFQKKEFIVQ